MAPDDIADLWDRFWSKVEVGDCWVWMGARSKNDYGTTSLSRRLHGGRSIRVMAHRASWEMLVGPIPDGLHVDHLCRNRACVNPDHLEPVTPKVNSERGFVARLRICKSGRHSMDDAYKKQGRRVCRECTKELVRNRYRAAKALGVRT